MLTTDNPRGGECYELGCSVYITKPVDYEAFSQAYSASDCFCPSLSSGEGVNGIPHTREFVKRMTVVSIITSSSSVRHAFMAVAIRIGTVRAPLSEGAASALERHACAHDFFLAGMSHGEHPGRRSLHPGRSGLRPSFSEGAFVLIVITVSVSHRQDEGGREGLYRVNESLEQRVVERTHELERAHAFLRTSWTACMKGQHH